MIENRNKILQAAARVYAQLGFRGATTRRIAEEAGVNEVTLFRQFGSKEALLEAAMFECARFESAASLPLVPQKPPAELLLWATQLHENLCRHRHIVRQLLSEADERPSAHNCAAHGPSSAAAQLREYIVTLRRNGWLEPLAQSGTDTDPADVRAAVTMLLGAIFADALNRDVMSDLYALPVDNTITAYIRLFLRALGVRYAPVNADPPESNISV